MDNNMITATLNRYQSPVYFFDEPAFLSNYYAFVNTFKQIYPKYTLSYSYKTNYVPYICRLVKDNGGYAEVVSDMEYTLAKKLGYSNDKIVYNGPVKGPLMEEHLQQGGILNIDNYEEAQRVCDLASRHPNMKFKIGVRINLDVTTDFISRFGFELGSDLLEKAIQRLNLVENIQIAGVHGHSGHARGINAWARRVEILLKAADKIVGSQPEYISLGSGMFGRMDDRLASQFPVDIPSYQDYANTVLVPIAEHYASLPEEDKPVVFTEPGATVISAYISFAASITSFKCIRGRDIAICDGSFYNLGEICRNRHLPLDIIPSSSEKRKFDCVDIVGYTCLENDILYKQYAGELGIGDIVLFGNVGGYSVVSKPQFIQPNFPMVAIKENGDLIEIMRPETFEDVFAKFLFI